ncbi:MAG: hypothetical protein V1847_05285 [Candidatus Diapherotrites archaeon]
MRWKILLFALALALLVLVGCNEKPKCGNGVCDSLEQQNPNLCPKDCQNQPVCGNGSCETGETATNCTQDCQQAVCGNGNCESGETKSSCSQDCGSAILPTGQNTLDADGVFWGTEIYGDQLASTKDVVDGVLKTKHLKIRVNAELGQTSFSPTICVPGGGGNCWNLDELAQEFEDNEYSMAPMLSLEQKNASSLSEEDIENYVNFVDWFVSRYKEKANIEYVELQNAPMSAWKGTPEQLLEAQNKIYDKIKAKYPDIQVGTPGFEYMLDKEPSTDKAIEQIEYFLDSSNEAKFDFWAFHMYPALDPDSHTTYAPTQSALLNKYSGMKGILEIRKKMNENGWSDREMIDTEHTSISGGNGTYSESGDKTDAAYLIQAETIKRTLKVDGEFVLSGIVPLKMISRTQGGEHAWGSLKPDNSASYTVIAIATLLGKLNEYNHDSHVSGELDSEDVWIEKFKDGSKELYVFFKPFNSSETMAEQLDQEEQNYSLSLDSVPSKITLSDIEGNETNVAPSQSVSLQAKNSPQYLEVEYGS